jgi:hypothetical protein
MLDVLVRWLINVKNDIIDGPFRATTKLRMRKARKMGRG